MGGLLKQQEQMLEGWRGTRVTEAEEWWLVHHEGAESITWLSMADSEGSAYVYLTIQGLLIYMRAAALTKY